MFFYLFLFYYSTNYMKDNDVDNDWRASGQRLIWMTTDMDNESTTDVDDYDTTTNNATRTEKGQTRNVDDVDIDNWNAGAGDGRWNGQ